jgi:alginate O-acetyltransferase complex protein AlgI
VLVNRRLQGGGAVKARSRAIPDPTRTLMGRMSNFAGMALTFALMSFSQIFWHSPTWGQALSILKQVLALTPSGPLGLSHLGLDVVVPVSICAAIALFVGAGAPGAKWFAAQAERVAPHWLQYGVCLFLLTVLSTEGGGRFIYGQF